MAASTLNDDQSSMGKLYVHRLLLRPSTDTPLTFRFTFAVIISTQEDLSFLFRM
jgi:hypothetical protein